MDDDEMMEVLRAALADDAPPRHVVAAAEAAGSWLRPDAELADLLADSADELVPTGVRGTSDRRQLTYAAADLTVDCEIGPDGLVGQVIPVPAGMSVELVAPDGFRRPVDLRPDGGFLVPDLPGGPVGLRLDRPDHPPVLTPWLLP